MSDEERMMVYFSQLNTVLNGLSKALADDGMPAYSHQADEILARVYKLQEDTRQWVRKRDLCRARGESC